MLIKPRNPGRRRVLQGLLGGSAVNVTLPFLDCFLNEQGTALAATNTPIPTRFGTWFWGLGMNRREFIPKIVGANFDLPPEIAALKDVKQHLNLFTKFNIPLDTNPNLCHYSGWVAMRCGATPRNRTDLPGESLDLPIARAIANGTPFRSINLASTGNPRDSYSFQNSDSINPAEPSPLKLYQKLFASPTQANGGNADPRLLLRRSVLSGVLEQSRATQRSIGIGDRQRLDAYFTAIRELEQRLDLQMSESPSALVRTPPPPPPELPAGLDYRLVEERHRNMTDLLVLALASNQTRIFNMLYSNSASLVTKQGLGTVHHNITHEELFDPVRGIQVQSSFFLREAFKAFAYFVAALARQPEGSGSLLDHMLVYAHSDNEDAKTHVVNGVPMFTAGRAGGRLKTGLHVDGGGDVASRLGYTVQRAMGLQIGEWGAGSLRTSREISEILA